MDRWTSTKAWTKLGRSTLLRTVLFTWSFFQLTLGAYAGPAHRPHTRNQIKCCTYFNDRFGYALSYPENVLYPQGEAGNGDGQKFMSIHADAVLTVYGRYNTLNESLESLYDEAARGGLDDHPTKVVTYHVLSRNWFVVSGYDRGQIFYEKTIINKDVIRSVDFVYPERQKTYYDPVAAKVAGSFRRL